MQSKLRRMAYSVKEIYYTLQGEGRQTGRPAVFLRFSGCNLWTGREQDREEAVCSFCDTDFVGNDGEGGGKFETPKELAQAVADTWLRNATGGVPFVVCTGGEPILQLDDRLIEPEVTFLDRDADQRRDDALGHGLDVARPVPVAGPPVPLGDQVSAALDEHAVHARQPSNRVERGID